MILNFSRSVHNYTARCEIEIKDDKKCPKTRPKAKLLVAVSWTDQRFPSFSSCVPLLSALFKKKLLETGVEFHSQFIQVCLSAIKTRQHALIFYTRRESQKAITHKFLIMFCLRVSVTTGSNRKRNFSPRKVSRAFHCAHMDKVTKRDVRFCHGHLGRRFNIRRHGQKSRSLIQHNWPRPKWVDILRPVMITKSRILKEEFAVSKLVFPGHGGSTWVRRLVKSYYFLRSL